MLHKVAKFIIFYCLLTGSTFVLSCQTRPYQKDILIDPETLETAADHPLLIGVDSLPDNWVIDYVTLSESRTDSNVKVIHARFIGIPRHRDLELAQNIETFPTSEKASLFAEEAQRLIDNARQNDLNNTVLPDDFLSIQDSQADHFASFCFLGEYQTTNCQIFVHYQNVVVGLNVKISDAESGFTQEAVKEILKDINQRVKALK